MILWIIAKRVILLILLLNFSLIDIQSLAVINKSVSVHSFLLMYEITVPFCKANDTVYVILGIE